MKLRIKNNSLRYRLTKSDVSLLAKEGYIEDYVNFAGNPFLYALQQTEGQVLTASYIDNKFTINISRKMVDELVNTDKVGFNGKDGELYLLIEKDFTCLDEVEEDQSDNYPNPLAKK